MPKPKPIRRDRVAELEDELKQRDARIKELRADLAKAEELVSEMREQVEDCGEVIESWKAAFDMIQREDGLWTWGPYAEAHDDLHSRYTKLLRDWNSAVADFNAVVRRRNVGRPLAASDAQRAQVLKQYKTGQSLRSIAEDTSLGLQTVRTIIDQGDGRDRTTVKHWQRIDPDRRREAEWRVRKRARDALPKRIDETLAKGRELVKEAKGLK